MALRAILTADEHSALSEELLKEYVEKDGKFVLDVTEVNGLKLEDTTALRSALQGERQKAQDANKALDAFKVDGQLLDPQKARDALTKIAEWADNPPEEKAKKQREAWEAQVLEKHQKELGKKDEDIVGLTKTLEDSLITQSATEAIIKAGGERGLKLLLPHVKAQTKLVKTEEGRYVAKVLDEDGNTRMTTEANSTSDMRIGELVAEMKNSDEFALAFDGSGTGGTGAGQNERPGESGGVTRIKAGDTAAMEANLEALAEGKAEVVS